jgi:hypothetical protein
MLPVHDEPAAPSDQDRIATAELATNVAHLALALVRAELFAMNMAVLTIRLAVLRAQLFAMNVARIAISRDT